MDLSGRIDSNFKDFDARITKIVEEELTHEDGLFGKEDEETEEESEEKEKVEGEEGAEG